MTVERLLACLFVAWLALTVLVQFRGRIQDRVRALDVLQLVPQWTFFAPRPGMEDYSCLYRDWFPDGQPTPWREIVGVSPRGWREAFWNPSKFEKKLLLDLIHELSSEAAQFEKHKADIEGLRLSVSYLTFLFAATTAARLSDCGIDTQFCILYISGPRPFRQSRLVLVSDVHPVADA
jgi:hypothetical protein